MTVSAAATPELPVKYDPAAVEVATYRRWEAAGYFAADPSKVLSGAKKPFSIVLPPPNVTGSLHIGHALDHTIMDILSRWHRMSGDETLWLPGMDHAGIATQNVVEKKLAADGKTRHDFGRELFVQKVWDWKAESGGMILGQMRRLGDSVDWSRERFTLDDGLSRAVTTIFKRLYDDDLIYRANRITHWCPGCQTALSDIEVEHSEDEGELVSLRYGDGDRSVVVATTRVETMLGDTAIAVHPDDERYRHLVGTTVTLPIVGREIPVVADEHVDPSFGTGAVKVTPAHDPNDFEIGRRHDLPAITIFDLTAHVTDTGTAFDGMDRFAARGAVKEELRRQGRVVAEKNPYLHAVGHCSRSDDVVEPRLSVQWFVKVGPLATAAGDAVRDGRTTIHPPELAARYFEWVDNMHDWTISRQLWWGHRIPVWYGPDGAVRCVGPDETAARRRLDAGPGRAGHLVLLRPVAVLDDGLAGRHRHAEGVLSDVGARHRLRHPVLLGRPDDDARPVRDEGRCRTGRVTVLGGRAARHGPRRARPQDEQVPGQRHRSDGLDRGVRRRRGAADAGPWRQSRRRPRHLRGLGRGLAQLLHQAVQRHPFRDDERGAPARGGPSGPVAGDLEDVDAWILDRLDETVVVTTELLGDFQIAKAAEGLYHFVWDELCDWYLEFAKDAIYGAPDRAEKTRAVLGHVLDTVLRLLHPFVPFVTETLWTSLTGRESLVIADWPTVTTAADPAAVTRTAARIADAQQFVTEVRRFRADQGLKPSVKVPAVITGLDAADLAGLEDVIRSVARLTPPGNDFAASVSMQVGLGVRTAGVELDTSGTIDVAAEKARLGKDLATAEKEAAEAAKKLGNEAFVGKAPTSVVDKIRDRQARAEADIERITVRLQTLDGAR